MVFSPHAFLDSSELLGPDVKTFTILREPLSNMRSHYNYHRRWWELGDYSEYLRRYDSVLQKNVSLQ